MTRLDIMRRLKNLPPQSDAAVLLRAKLLVLTNEELAKRPTVRVPAVSIKRSNITQGAV